MRKEAVDNIRRLDLCIPVYKKMDIKLTKDDSIYNFELKDHFIEKGNEVAFEILCKCDGEKSIKDIIDEMLTEYDVTLEELIKDVISILHEAWKKTVIIWNRENPFVQVYIKEIYKNGYVFKRLFAREFIKISKGISNNMLINDLINKEVWYQERHLDTMQRIGLEYYFGIMGKDKVRCLLALIPEVTFLEGDLKNISLKINYLFVDSVSENEFDEFLGWVVWFLFNVEEINMDIKSCFFQMEVYASIENDISMAKMGFEKVSIPNSLISHFEREQKINHNRKK